MKFKNQKLLFFLITAVLVQCTVHALNFDDNLYFADELKEEKPFVDITGPDEDQVSQEDLQKEFQKLNKESLKQGASRYFKEKNPEKQYPVFNEYLKQYPLDNEQVKNKLQTILSGFKYYNDTDVSKKELIDRLGTILNKKEIENFSRFANVLFQKLLVGVLTQNGQINDGLKKDVLSFLLIFSIKSIKFIFNDKNLSEGQKQINKKIFNYVIPLFLQKIDRLEPNELPQGKEIDDFINYVASFDQKAEQQKAQKEKLRAEGKEKELQDKLWAKLADEAKKAEELAPQKKGAGSDEDEDIDLQLDAKENIKNMMKKELQREKQKKQELALKKEQNIVIKNFAQALNAL